MRSRWLYRLANSSPVVQGLAVFGVLMLLVVVFEADALIFGGSPAHHAAKPVAMAPSPEPSASPAPTPSASPPASVPIPTSSTVAVAQVNVVVAHTSPDARSRVVANIPHHNLIGQETPFLVVASQPGWYQALLPVKPNGTTGWISSDQVRIQQVNDFLLASLSSFTLKHYQNGNLVDTFPIAVGAANTPTPTGQFYVWAIQQNPGPPYSPVIFALSAFSETLKNWPDGGIVGIHGWSDPSVEGKAISNGCLRMHQGDATKLESALPLGTPVEIVA